LPIRPLRRLPGILGFTVLRFEDIRIRSPDDGESAWVYVHRSHCTACRALTLALCPPIPRTDRIEPRVGAQGGSTGSGSGVALHARYSPEGNCLASRVHVLLRVRAQLPSAVRDYAVETSPRSPGQALQRERGHHPHIKMAVAGIANALVLASEARRAEHTEWSQATPCGAHELFEMRSERGSAGIIVPASFLCEVGR
jgi:hypothetical protein